MKSNLSDIASVAEIVASVGVILSLIFLGLEVSEGSRQTQAATAQLIIKNEMDMVAVLIDNSATWEKVVTGTPISPGEETRRAINLFQMVMLDSVNRYGQYKAGYLSQSTWDGQLATLPKMKQLPIYEKWRASFGSQSQNPEFRELLDSLPIAD